MLEPPYSPNTPLPAEREDARGQPPIPVLQGVLAQALCHEQLLLLSPSPPPLLLPPLGKEEQSQEHCGHPREPAAPQSPSHQGTDPAAGTPEETGRGRAA